MLSTGKYIIFNNHILPATEFEEQLISGTIVYEVVRVINGIPLFIEDHLLRLANSIYIAGKNYKINREEIESRLLTLIKVNEKEVGNIEIMFCFKPKLKIPVFFCRFIPHVYPDKTAYIQGVNVDFFSFERHKPNAKTKNLSLREISDKIIKEKNLYELILINKNNCILEGSRSNVFLIRNNSLYTAPEANVLQGITRKKVFSLCSELNIKIMEELVDISKLNVFQAMFLTGTSPSVLPVKKAGIHYFDVNHHLLRKLINAYAELMNKYVAEKKMRLTY